MASGNLASKSAEPASIAIIDYGMGNVQSVRGALARLGCVAKVVSDAKTLQAADGLILPGVGAFGLAMENLEKLGLINVLQDSVKAKTPLLGICLGMQLFAEDSEEKGNHRGLGLIPGRVKLIDSIAGKLPVPQVGWNTLKARASPLFTRVASGSHFYFDHSFHFDCPLEFRSSMVEYGTELVASVEKDNLFGVQFHPEKSHTAGLKLLRGFLNFVYEKRVVC
jgi:glutamine amidotransferase